MAKVAVIGACGHVGLPYAVINACKGHDVVGIDLNEKIIAQIYETVKFPYQEDGGDAALAEALDNGMILTSQWAEMIHCDIIAIMLGTPVDAENNPRLDYLMNFVDDRLIPYLRYRQENEHQTPPKALVLLRSTVAPGTTELINKKLQEAGLYHYDLVFAPERVAQGKSLVESELLPQLIGAFDNAAFERASQYFKTFCRKTHQLTPREAEFAKLITNMTRYVNFALANEFYILGEKQGINVNKVIDAANDEYPRLNLPTPGPNVGGPCLFKDGRFLLSGEPFVDLIQTAYIINEGMPEHLLNLIKQGYGGSYPKKIAIYGMTFKANSDDTRNSLSFKFKKACQFRGIEVSYTDPYYGTSNNFDGKEPCAVIMTPHDEYKYISLYENTTLVDVWKITKWGKNSLNGITGVNE